MSDDNEPRKPRSRYADKPYEVGKGKPPKQHQFSPGNSGGGRRKGSRNRNDFDKLLDERVVIGEDRLGRPRRKRWRDIINLQLLKKAAGSDLAAIRLVKEFELKMAMLAQKSGPPPMTAAEFAQAQAVEAEKLALAVRLEDKFAKHLELTAQLKRVGLVEYEDGKAVVPLWALEAAEAHRASTSIPGPCD